MWLIKACLPQGQPGRVVESVLRQSAFLQTDTPRKHAPSEASCSQRTHERALLCVFAAIKRRSSCFDINRKIPRLLNFRHTGCPAVLVSSHFNWRLLQFVIAVACHWMLPLSGLFQGTEVFLTLLQRVQQGDNTSGLYRSAYRDNTSLWVT